jgi:hypothetical protein
MKRSGSQVGSVVPYEAKTLLVCLICTHGFELNGDQVLRAKQVNIAASAFLAQQMGEAEFQATVRTNRVLG